MVFLNSRTRNGKKLVEKKIEFSRKPMDYYSTLFLMSRSVMLRMKDIEDVFPQ